jgi:hypothetical protein
MSQHYKLPTNFQQINVSNLLVGLLVVVAPPNESTTTPSSPSPSSSSCATRRRRGMTQRSCNVFLTRTDPLVIIGRFVPLLKTGLRRKASRASFLDARLRERLCARARPLVARVTATVVVVTVATVAHRRRPGIRDARRAPDARACGGGGERERRHARRRGGAPRRSRRVRDARRVRCGVAERCARADARDRRARGDERRWIG